jgi:Flp pilus assembly protein TadD
MQRTGACLGLVAALLLTGCAKRMAPPPEAARAPETTGPRMLVHEVAPGETLALIADNYYGDPDAAARIARDNGIEDPARLATGSTLLLRFDRGSWAEARRRSAALEPYNRGVEAFERDDLETAENQFRLALRTAPALVSARYNLALVLGQRGRHEEAQSILADLHALRPGDPHIGFALGHTLFQQGDFVRAAKVFSSVLLAHPDHRRAAFGLARSLQESGDTAGAVAAWRRYLELDATSSWADQARRHLRDLGG